MFRVLTTCLWTMIGYIYTDYTQPGYGLQQNYGFFFTQAQKKRDPALLIKQAGPRCGFKSRNGLFKLCLYGFGNVCHVRANIHGNHVFKNHSVVSFGANGIDSVDHLLLDGSEKLLLLTLKIL